MTARLLAALSAPGDTASLFNEDALWCWQGDAVVLDGVSGLPGDHYTTGPTDASWLAAAVVSQLERRKDVAEPFEHKLGQSLGAAIECLQEHAGTITEPHRAPMAALGALSIVGDRLRYWLLGDVELLAWHPSGRVQRLQDDRCHASERRLLVEWHRLSTLGIPYADRREAVRPLIRESRKSVNSDTGYWLFGITNPNLSHAIAGELEIASGTRLMLATDGMLRCSTLLGVDDQAYFADGEVGLRQLLKRLRASEAEDTECVQWPRVKCHDDATALILEAHSMQVGSPRPQFTDHLAKTFPVSVKGIVHYNGQFALLRNERDEWELPGGKLEADEQPESCVVREIQEELGLTVALNRIVDSWVYDIQGRVKVLIVTYLCEACEQLAQARVSSEHKELKLFTIDDLPRIKLPDGYRASLLRGLGQSGSSIG